MVNPTAAAIDIGSTMHMTAVSPDACDTPVKSFGTFTQDLNDLADWFKACGVTSIAMESTGVYWIPAFEVLEARGFKVILVNARYAKNVPGRKTDVSDAGWLRQLYSYGLLRGSFRPEAEIATLRAYLRQHERLVEHAAAHIQHMQKALIEVNLQVHHVVSDIKGATGMRIIRAIVAGERDPDVLASFRNVRCHSSIEVIKAALVCNDRDEHIFALTQSLDLYDFYQTKIEECNRKLEAAVAALTIKAICDVPPLAKARTKRSQVSVPSFDVRAALYGVLGTDLTQIHGLGPSLALKLVAECGTDLQAWKGAKHFTSWLCFVPGNRISGGKLLSSRTRRSSSRAAALLRLAAVTIGRSDTALGAFYRRLSSRIGKRKAVTATARKIAVLFYNAIRFGMACQDPGAAAYEERHRSRVLANLHRRAGSLGYAFAPLTNKPLRMTRPTITKACVNTPPPVTMTCSGLGMRGFRQLHPRLI
uniref:IS110 family transposase n=1 Tax=Pseudorhodobacter aquimaris TaxID=687412 RepID=UPI001E3B44E8|nr:IS110 family transposase [Pseudorhodobacter aquimaris]